MTDQRAKALEVAISQIERQFGKGSIMRFNDGSQPQVSDSDREHRARSRARHRWGAAWPDR
ncbi:MAG: hypothetical protein R2845_01750 [Thermomicrobiales bacterium]